MLARINANLSIRDRYAGEMIIAFHCFATSVLNWIGGRLQRNFSRYEVRERARRTELKSFTPRGMRKGKGDIRG